jgi:hypothetical protein
MSTIKVTNVNPPTAGQAVNINGLAYPSAGPLSNRNLIINGAMQVWQRSTSVTGVADNTNEGYQSVDRYGFSFGSTHGGACTISKSTTVPSGEGFAQSYKVDISTSATPTANQLTAIYTKIEAQDIANSGWDYTSTSSYITLSFWARSSKAGTYCVYIDSQDAATYEKYVKEYALVADTWKRVEITVPGKSTLAYNNDNGVGMNVFWTLSAGSSRNGSTADTWETGDNVATSNQVNFFDSTSNDFYLTGVQLEVGSVATPFEHRSYGDELHRCQRYYKRLSSSASNSYARLVPLAHMGNSTTLRCVVPLNPSMRAQPTFNQSGSFLTQPSVGTPGLAIDSAASAGSESVTLFDSSSISGTAGTSVAVYANNNSSTFVEFSAEL